MTNEWLNALKVGNTVFIKHTVLNRLELTPVKIVRLTATQIIVEGIDAKFRRKDGSEIIITSEKYGFLRKRHLWEYNVENILKYERETELQEFSRKLNEITSIRVHLDGLTSEQMASATKHIDALVSVLNPRKQS